MSTTTQQPLTWKKPSLKKAVDLINKHLEQVHHEIGAPWEFNPLESCSWYRNRWKFSSSKKEGGRIEITCSDILKAKDLPKCDEPLSMRVRLEATNTGISLNLTPSWDKYGIKGVHYTPTQITEEVAEIIARRYYEYCNVIEQMHHAVQRVEEEFPLP
jgi:hypothetical protein